MAKSKKLAMLTLATIACGCFAVAVGCSDPGAGSSEHTCPHVCTYATDMSKDATHHWYACTDTTCTKTVGKVEHIWDEGAITTAPTTAAEGVKTFNCVVCAQTKTESITAYGVPTAGTGADADEYVIANNTTYLVENEIEYGYTNFIQYKYTVAITGALKVSVSETAKFIVVKGFDEVSDLTGDYSFPVEEGDEIIVKVGGLFADDAEEGDTLQSTLKLEETTEAPVADGTIFNPYSLNYDEDMGTYTLNTNIKNDSYIYYTATGEDTVQVEIIDWNGIVTFAAQNLTTNEEAYAGASETLYINATQGDVIKFYASLISFNIIEATVSINAAERDTVYEDGTKAYPYTIDEGDDFTDTWFAENNSVYFSFTAPANGTASIANHEQHKLTVSYGPMWNTQFICQDFIPRTTDALDMEVEAGVTYTIVITNQDEEAWTVSPVFTFEAAEGGDDSDAAASIALNSAVAVATNDVLTIDLTGLDASYAIATCGVQYTLQQYIEEQDRWISYDYNLYGYLFGGNVYELTVTNTMPSPIMTPAIIVAKYLPVGEATDVTVGDVFVVDATMLLGMYEVTTNGSMMTATYQAYNANMATLVSYDYTTMSGLMGGNLDSIYLVTIEGMPGATGTVTLTEVTE